VEIYRKTTKDFNILHYLNDSTINFTPAFHEKVKEQLPCASIKSTMTTSTTIIMQMS